MEGDWVEFEVGSIDGKGCSESIIEGVSFDDNL